MGRTVAVVWGKKAKLQRAADKNDMKTCYTGFREVYGPQNRGTAQLLDQDGERVFTAKDDTLKIVA